MDLVSVIVPVYNTEKYLMRCIESIMRQTYENLEIILVDDGATDSCPLLCEELKKTDSRIVVLHKQNEGLGKARNSGLSLAKGKYVTFVDSDDWISEKHIENLYSAIVKYDADLAIGSHTIVDSELNQKICPLKIKACVYESDSIEDDILLNMIAPSAEYEQDVRIESSVCMNLYRLDLIQANNLRFTSERVSVAEDLLFHVDYIRLAGRITVVEEFGYYYFENNLSITRKYNPMRYERTMRFYEIITQKVSELGLLEKGEARIFRCFLMKIRVMVRLIAISDLSQRDKLHEIKKVITHHYVQRALLHYPIEQYALALRMLAYSMKIQSALLVYYLVKLREGGRKNKLFVFVLRKLGVGK